MMFFRRKFPLMLRDFELSLLEDRPAEFVYGSFVGGPRQSYVLVSRKDGGPHWTASFSIQLPEYRGEKGTWTTKNSGFLNLSPSVVNEVLQEPLPSAVLESSNTTEIQPRTSPHVIVVYSEGITGIPTQASNLELRRHLVDGLESMIVEALSDAQSH